MAFGFEVICHLGKITIIRKMAWLFFWQQWRKGTDFSAYKDKSLRNLKRFQDPVWQERTSHVNLLDLSKTKLFFFKSQNHKRGRMKFKRKKEILLRTGFWDWDDKNGPFCWGASLFTGPCKKHKPKTVGLGGKSVDFQGRDLEDGFTRVLFDGYGCFHCK